MLRGRAPILIPLVLPMIKLFLRLLLRLLRVLCRFGHRLLDLQRGPEHALEELLVLFCLCVIAVRINETFLARREFSTSLGGWRFLLFVFEYGEGVLVIVRWKPRVFGMGESPLRVFLSLYITELGGLHFQVFGDAK